VLGDVDSDFTVGMGSAKASFSPDDHDDPPVGGSALYGDRLGTISSAWHSTSEYVYKLLPNRGYFEVRSGIKFAIEPSRSKHTQLNFTRLLSMFPSIVTSAMN
jgi:hypothetical protein